MRTSVTRYSLFKITFLSCLGVFIILSSYNCSNSPSSESVDADATALAARAVTGEELYVSYCQTCHGVEGVQGAMAEMLTVEVPDLRYISARRNGSFPKEDLHKIIDGRNDVKGHGTRDMPIWGLTFKASEMLKTEAEVKDRIAMVVNYLKSIQQEEMPVQ